MNNQQTSFKAVVFDVDGTLIDSVDVHAEAWVHAFAEFGHKVRVGDVRRQIGKGGD
jgi:beta-phosphoglucomutase-like phosphatase (HAD superfamily)